jgi:hypothetical protein
MPGIFISYRKKDAGGHAGHLHENLTRRYGKDAVFMDIEIRGGLDFKKRIHEALDSSDIALVLIGESWAPSGDGSETPRRIDDENDLLRQEVAVALKHPTATVVPVLVEDAEIPKESDLPADIAALPNLQVCRLQNSNWQSDFKRICRAVDEASSEAGSWSAASRAIRGLPERLGPRLLAAMAALAAVVLIAAIALVGLGSEGGGSPECANRFISPQARERLAEAAANPKDPVEGSVYYGSCGSRTWALAAFPDGTDGVFVQSDLEWVDLGRIAAVKCAQVPEELLTIWKQDDC